MSEKLPDGVTVDARVWEEVSVTNVEGSAMHWKGTLHLRRRPAPEQAPHEEAMQRAEDIQFRARIRGWPDRTKPEQAAGEEGVMLPGLEGRWKQVARETYLSADVDVAMVVHSGPATYLIRLPAPAPKVDWSSADWRQCGAYLQEQEACVIPATWMIGLVPDDEWRVAGRVITAMRERGYRCNLREYEHSTLSQFGKPSGDGWYQAVGHVKEAPLTVLRAACLALQAEKGETVHG